MSKHSLISTVAGLGLMAASMGASAQLHTFDYSSMYYGTATGGSKYVAFVPTMTRGGADEGSVNVLMLEMFQPASGSASTWAYALGGEVGLGAGGSGGAASAALQTIEWTAENGVASSGRYYFGNNEAISMPFVQGVTVSSQACNVSFVANIGVNDQLAFDSITAQPVGLANWASASAPAGVSVSTGAGVLATTMAQTLWNAGASSMSAYAGASVTISGLDAALAGSAMAAMIAGRNKCVPAYTARASSGATVITPTGPATLGMVRVW